MKIIWITNNPLPFVLNAINRPGYNTGGWMIALYQALETYDLEICCIAPERNVKKLTKIQIGKGIHYLFPFSKNYNNSTYKKYWLEINNTFNPDCIHIHGTEFSHGLSFIRYVNNIPIVASIQGLVGPYARYQFAGIPRNL